MMGESASLSQWLGGHYVIVLKEPFGQRIQGILQGLVPEQHLTLDQALLLDTNQFLGQVDIRADNVTDIMPVPGPAVKPAESSSRLTTGRPMPMAAFQDPAILSLTPKSTPKSDGNSGPGPRYHHAQPNTAEKRDPVILNPADRLTYSSPDETTDSAVPGGLDAHVAQLKLSPINSSKLAFATSDQENLESLPSATLDPGAPGPRKENGKSARGRGRRRNKVGISNGSPAPTGGNKGAGWRQTPMLQSSASFQPFASLKKSQKRRVDANVANVWASEDVTDVQEAGDFDFEGSLAKFDKRKIFDEMKEQDQIDEAERLVSHNRLPRPKPGTAGGKNLHYTENVLDLPQAASRSKVGSGDYWKSEADDEIINGDDRTSVIEGSGRTSRLRGESRVSMSRRSQSRKASTTASVSGSSRVNSAPVPSSSGLYAVPSNRRIESIPHLQMQAVENVAHHEFGFTEDLMAENAGRGITEVAMHALDDPAVKLLAATASPPNTTTIVVLAGNSKSGVRALAAARHLRNRGINVLVCVVGIERERELFEDVKKQVRLFRTFGGVIFTKSELFAHVSPAAKTFNASQGSITLIIDALLGLTMSFEELRKSDQATTYELMEWANRNEAFVMAIDIPSGVEPQTGRVMVIDGAKLYVHPRYVVALGAPKVGLLKALEMGDDQGDIVMVEEWKLFLADIGLSPLVWRKVATKVRRGIEFDSKWVLELRYKPHGEEED
ncbi:YjeF N-terminal domain-like protein [Hypoxylon fragiforme]|uniref:YjeF N-terminal domain-like protein n=1 Tax=Hypoxylon fragiforme TaxID=63214 RepID=UPI0020C65945|nr:YjeF N-terminal domain-like protein [Hypoxylon fragiforme]KAI2613197.1 YjeF N-terminal domain-like protein [Hypoxylon fragiforme]